MQRITIRNIGPIREAIDVRLPGITVLLGEQATGKSTLAMCVHFFRSLEEDLANEAFNFHRGATSDEALERLQNTIRSKFYVYFGSSERLDDFELVFYYSDARYIRVFKEGNTQAEFSLAFEVERLCRAVVEHFEMYFPNPSARAAYLKTLFRSHFFELNGERQSRFSEECYFPASRNVATMFSEQFRDLFLDNFKNVSLLAGQNKPNSAHIQLMQQFVQLSVSMKEKVGERNGNFEGIFAGRPRQNMREQFLERANAILKAKYIINSQGEEKLKIERNKHIDLGKASSGQQSVVRVLQDIALIIADNQFTTRTIEEPEVHLFPEAQHTLAELFVMCHNLTGTEFILTTHSPYFVAMFNNMLYAARAAQFQPDQVAAIGYPANLRLPLDHFSAYIMENGRAQSIYDSTYGLTSIDDLDAVSLDIGARFGALADIIHENEAV